MRADLLWRYGLGLEQRGHGVIDLAALGMNTGYIDQHPCSPLSRQPGGIHCGGGTQRPACVAELDSDRDLIQPRIGRAEFGVVLVVLLAEPPGDLAALLELALGEVGIVDVGGDDGTLQGQPAPQGHRLRVTLVS